MQILPLREDLLVYLQKHNLIKKWLKVETLLTSNLKHPSLNVELLEPKHRGIFSFRIDKKYRALFFVKDGCVEIFAITNHYK
jgi:Txe/YoeB family toxin of Txe-Axe toxin-antitoxin module